MGERSGCGDGEWQRFTFRSEDVPLFREVGGARESLTELDSVLCSLWDDAMRRGAFRYDLSDISTRVIPGKHGFIAQRNPKRFSHRRPPADMSSLTQPFDPSLFNFNKIKRHEVLLEVHRKTSSTDSENPHQSELNLIIVNVSPIDYGHVLLVPDPKGCLPQVMTEESLRLCLDIVALSGHRGFCMVGNSLLAYASVNHLHYHFLYLDHPVLARRVSGKVLSGGCYELTGHPSRGFAFQLDSSTATCAREMFKVISLLLELGIPHNVAMLRGEQFAGSAAPGTVVRTLLLPRKPALGFKKLYETEQRDIPPFFAAACELVLGFIPVLDQTKFSTLTEEEVMDIVHEKTLTENEFTALKEKVAKTLGAKAPVDRKSSKQKQ